MDIRHRAFLNILRAALEGRPARLSQQLTAEDWKALSVLAWQQHVQPLFYEAVCHDALARQALEGMAAQVRRQVAGQTLRTQKLLQIAEGLEKAGIRAAVVKGIVCRELYPLPDHRPSSDEDLLTDPGAFLACGELLEENGMTTQDPEEAFERTYRGGDTPLCIELHNSLFSPQSQAYSHWNKFFEHALDRAEPVTVQGVRVLTLAPDDHMLYLLLHAFKHFLHSGFGLRQVCDIALFANAWGSRIHWQQLLEQCRQIRAERFAAAVFRISEKYFGFDPVRAGYPACWQALEVDEQPLLEDLLEAGVYGGATAERKRSSHVTLQAAAGKGGSALKSALFPPRSSLCGRYPYLKKHPWLLPWAWLCRIFTYRTHHRSAEARQSLQIGNRRLQLLKLYGITEE